MPQRARWIFLFLLVAGIVSWTAEATAQPQPPPATPEDSKSKPTPTNSTAGGEQSPDDDDRRLRLAEPDFTVINLPTTLVLPRHTFNFRLTHRFLGDLTEGSFTDQLDNIFGLDNGAVIGLELRFAPIRHVQAIVFRNNLAKTIQFTGQYDAIRQSASFPVSASAIVSIEGTNNFRPERDDGSGGHRSPALGGIVSRSFSDRLAVYAVPMWVHDVVRNADRDTFYIGVGGRGRISRNVYVVGEVSPRVNGFAPGDVEYAFGIERRAGGHMFQLTFTNSVASTYGQIAQGGLPDTLYLGFNLGRKFY